ncbi:hypothetical protein MNV49_005831 [Pseudohyphozyma bogoriensis]|nr:hypothetical protein MNV49_005831 [Pseudohyphozyma bogoriensis]
MLTYTCTYSSTSSTGSTVLWPTGVSSLALTVAGAQGGVKFTTAAAGALLSGTLSTADYDLPNQMATVYVGLGGATDDARIIASSGGYSSFGYYTTANGLYLTPGSSDDTRIITAGGGGGSVSLPVFPSPPLPLPLISFAGKSSSDLNAIGSGGGGSSHVVGPFEAAFSANMAAAFVSVSYTVPCTALTPIPTGVTRRRRDLVEKMKQKYLKAHPNCPAEQRACSLPSGNFECIEYNELSSCGGCVSEGTGVDCLELPGVNGVTCLNSNSPSPRNDVLARASTLSLIAVQLAEEGRMQLKALDERCIYGSAVSRLRNPGPVDEFILGPTPTPLPSHINMVRTSTHLNLSHYGANRAHKLVQVSSRVWDSLEHLVFRSSSLTAKQSSYTYTQKARLVEAIQMAAKTCDDLRDSMSKLRARRLFAWGVDRAVEVLDAPLELVGEVDLERLQTSVIYLALRECCESLSLGLPSAVSTYAYARATGCSIYTTIPPPTPSSLSPFFLSGPLDGDGFRDHVVPILTPSSSTASALLRDLTENLHTPNIRYKMEYWWELMDRLYEFFDLTADLVASDPRNTGECKRRVEDLLRAVATVEQCLVEMTTLAHLGLMRALARGENDDKLMELVARSNVRMHMLMIRGARRMGAVMATDGSALDVYTPLAFFFRNMNVMGDAIMACLAGLPRREIAFVARAAKFAAFWDASAVSLDQALDKLSLDDRAVPPTLPSETLSSDAATMVRRALADLL